MAKFKRPLYVSKETTRHGQTVFYFRRFKEGKRIRLPDITSDKFAAAYAKALASCDNIVRLPKKLTMDERVAQMVEKAFIKNLSGAKSRSKAKGREFSIDLTWALETARAQGFKCAVTKIPFYSEDGSTSIRRHPFAPSFDRIDPSNGYTKDNVRIVILALNVMFADWGPLVFDIVANNYRKHKMETLFDHRDAG